MSEQPNTPNPADPAVDAEVPENVAAEAEAQVDADVEADIGPDGAAPTTDGPEAAGAASGDGAAEAGADAEDAPPAEPDWRDRYVRSVAELENVRKRARRDAAAGESRGIVRLAKELLPAMDNLDRAIQHVDETPDGDPQLVEGLRIVHRELHAALAQAGVESYDPTGQPFDPRVHEALTTVPADDSVLAGTVVTVYQAGYRRGDDILRAAKVVVAG